MSDQYILIERGGHTQGQRPRTQLARVASISSDHRVVFAFIERRAGETKHSVRIPFNEVIKQWPYRPTQSEIRAVRQAQEKM